MSKKNKTPLAIFTESIGLYFSNFDKFVKYMTFPVLGQIGGISIVFLLTYFYAKHMPAIVEKIPVLQNLTLLIVLPILIILPGLAIFVKSFWEYLIAYGAVNSMLENMLKSGKVYDFDAHTELIKRRTMPFVGLWFLFGIFSLISVVPFFWVPCGVFAIFFVLIFQVFTFEPEQTPFGCVKRSLELVKGHFLSTFLLFVSIGALTYFLIPQLATFFFEYTNIEKFLSVLILPFIETFPLNDWNNILALAYLPPLEADKIALFTVSVTITQIFIQYTLPMRSILWAMWYKELRGKSGGKYQGDKSCGGKCQGGKYSNEDKPKKSGKKKPSEKLIESSNKKYSSKKIDRNILRRAMEKEDND